MSHTSDQDLPDLPDDVDIVVQGTAVASAPGGAEAGERPLRELGKAPRHLRLAAVIVVAGSLLPWMGHGGGWVTLVAAKLVALLGAWLWLQQVAHDWRPEQPSPLAVLAKLQLGGKKKDDEKPKRRRAEPAAPVSPMAHPPSALQILSVVVGFGLGCALLPSLDSAPGARPLIAMAEVGMLAWAATTWVHVHAYQRWGSFNPLFALMFVGMFLAGLTRIAAGIAAGPSQLPGLFAVAGGAIVAAGGGLAAFTIVEALMQAKREGDAKKQAAAEARRAARAAKGGDAGARRR